MPILRNSQFDKAYKKLHYVICYAILRNSHFGKAYKKPHYVICYANTEEQPLA